MNQIERMFALQKQLNDQTNGEIWITGVTKENRKISWYRGIYMEVAEAIDSFNWKHWKNINDQPDWDNICSKTGPEASLSCIPFVGVLGDFLRNFPIPWNTPQLS